MGCCGCTICGKLGMGRVRRVSTGGGALIRGSKCGAAGGAGGRKLAALRRRVARRASPELLAEAHAFVTGGGGTGADCGAGFEGD